MVKLALCDDDRLQLDLLDALLEEYSRQRPQAELTVTAFSSAALLLEHLRAKGAFDIYLLDVIMPEENGIELGLHIREIDRAGHIVYLTASPDFAVDSYRARASDYLLKPVDKTRLFETMDGILERLTQEQGAFVAIKTRDGLRRLPLWSVIYGELVDRCVHYHLLDGSVLAGLSLRGSFQEAVSPFLAHRRFVLCATSFFVNLSFVERVEPTCLRLSDGGTLPLSRSHRAKVTDQWLDYCLEGGQ